MQNKNNYSLYLLNIIGLVFLMSNPGIVYAVEPIKLVYGEALSGNFQDVGERSLKGVEHAVKEINSKGGILGRQVELYTFDHEFKMDVTTRKATEFLLKQKAHYFLGGTGSPIANAMSSFGRKNKVLVFTYMWPPENLTGKNCHKYFIRPSVSTNMQSYALAHWVVQKGYKKIYCIAQDWNFGIEAVDAFERKLKELDPNIEIVGKIFHKPGEKEYAPYVSQAAATKPDLIFTPNWGNDLRLLVKQAGSLGLQVPWATYFLGDVENIKAIDKPEDLVGSVTCEDYLLTIPGDKNKNFRESFFKENGFYPTWTAGKAYIAVMYWAEAVKAAGKDDVEEVIKSWEGLKYNSLAGDIVIRPCDHQALRPVWIAEIVERSDFYDHPFLGEAKMISAKDVETPEKDTGCRLCK